MSSVGRDDQDLDPLVAGPWQKDDATLTRWSLRAGGRRHEVWADEPTARALFAALAAAARPAPPSLENVPLAMIGTFRVDDPHVKATAVSRGNLEMFWAASTERSRKKLGAPPT